MQHIPCKLSQSCCIVLVACEEEEVYVFLTVHTLCFQTLPERTAHRLSEQKKICIHCLEAMCRYCFLSFLPLLPTSNMYFLRAHGSGDWRTGKQNSNCWRVESPWHTQVPRGGQAQWPGGEGGAHQQWGKDLIPFRVLHRLFDGTQVNAGMTGHGGSLNGKGKPVGVAACRARKTPVRHFLSVLGHVNSQTHPHSFTHYLFG